jgi:phosphatidylinositol phospholipase C gamma-1
MHEQFCLCFLQVVDALKLIAGMVSIGNSLLLVRKCIKLLFIIEGDGMPLIFHGKTLTTKIPFLEVIKTIRDHAFVTSE